MPTRTRTTTRWADDDEDLHINLYFLFSIYQLYSSLCVQETSWKEGGSSYRQIDVFIEEVLSLGTAHEDDSSSWINKLIF